MQRTWSLGSPDSQLARWLMIASIPIAVLPVCRSPMISSLWPRPMAVIASMALMPVCSGSLTGWRSTTEGACVSSGRSSWLSMGPLPSSGSPSGPTTRPRKPSPTGTDRISPVRLTCWPSSISLNSPRMTTPISRTSRLSARPRTPFSNTSSSLAMAEGRPSTRAMPSPASMTVPTSSRAAPAGSYSWTKRDSASRISSGRMVSSAIALPVLSFVVLTASGSSAADSVAGISARLLAPDLGQATGRGPVNKVIPDLDGYSTNYRRIDDNIQVNVVPVGAGQCVCEPPALARGELGRRADHRDQLLPAPRRDVGTQVQGGVQGPSARMRDHLVDQAEGHVSHFAVEQGAEKPPLSLLGQRRIGQCGPQVGSRRDHPAEPEQPVLQVVQVALRLGGQHHRLDRELLDRVDHIAAGRPVGLDGRPDQRLGALGDLAVQQRAGHRGLLRRGLARVGQRAPQPVLGVEQPDDREQLAAQPSGHGGAGDVLGGQPLGEFGERGSTHTAHAHSPCCLGRLWRRAGRAWKKFSAERSVVPAPGLVVACRTGATPAPARRGTGPPSGPAARCQ